jgi:hypothetical protein
VISTRMSSGYRKFATLAPFRLSDPLARQRTRRLVPGAVPKTLPRRTKWPEDEADCAPPVLIKSENYIRCVIGSIKWCHRFEIKIFRFCSYAGLKKASRPVTLLSYVEVKIRVMESFAFPVAVYAF